MRNYLSNADESVRMFRSEVLESLSHVHPAVPHLIFLPVIILALAAGLGRGAGAGASLLLFAAGAILWTLTEYVIHRFTFHVPRDLEERTNEAVARVQPGDAVLPHLRWSEKLYFLVHGVHHLYPNDSRRLVMPPAVSVPLAVFFYFLFGFLLGSPAALPFFAGFVGGYLAYDTTHYAVHHFRCRSRWSAHMKKIHMRHHYLNPDRNYGVSTPLWDLVLGTSGGPREARAP